MATTPAVRTLFTRFPMLSLRLPLRALADLPTPVERFAGLEDALGAAPLYVKRDDLSGATFGGNKVRKLEFLLGAALAAGARTAITVGAAGSNHALATAICCRQLGLRPALMLYPQPNAHVVRQNLLADLWTRADVHAFQDYAEHRANLRGLVAHYREQDHAEPCVIPTGGSNPVGAAGYVNAGLELAAQIADGALERPTRIYVALGSMGTVAGLWLGLAVAGVRTTVVGVRVTPPAIASEERLAELITQTASMLHGLDPSFPLPDPSVDPPLVDHRFFGGEYARFTPESVAAVHLAHDSAGMALDGTYTGKALAGLIADVKAGKATEPLMFWNTRNSRPLPEEALRGDYHRLPSALWRYFEEDVQPLDREERTDHGAH